MASCTPSARTRAITSITVSASSISTLSVISKHRFDGSTPVLRDHLGDAVGEVGLHELARRQVDRDLEGLGVLELPARRVAGRLLDHPLADLHDQPGLLGQRDELGRPDRAHARDAASARSASAPMQRASESPTIGWKNRRNSPRSSARCIAFSVACARQRARAHRVVEHLDPTAAELLGVVHRGVGVAEQLFGALVTGRGERDADARTDEHLGAAHDHRPDDRGEEPLRDLDRQVARGVEREVLAEDRELVAAEPGHGVARPDHRLRACAPLPRAARRPRRGRGCR